MLVPVGKGSRARVWWRSPACCRGGRNQKLKALRAASPASPWPFRVPRSGTSTWHCIRSSTSSALAAEVLLDGAAAAAGGGPTAVRQDRGQGRAERSLLDAMGSHPDDHHCWPKSGQWANELQRLLSIASLPVLTISWAHAQGECLAGLGWARAEEAGVDSSPSPGRPCGPDLTTSLMGLEFDMPALNNSFSSQFIHVTPFIYTHTHTRIYVWLV